MEFINTEKRIDKTEISYIIDGFKNGTIKDGDLFIIDETRQFENFLPTLIGKL